jgi:hypothetical protein
MAGEIVEVEKVRNGGKLSIFEPQSLTEAIKLAEMMAKSDLVPRDMKDKPGNVLVAIQMGAEVGLKPMQAMQNIAVINGRPTIWGDALLALVQASGLLLEFEEHYEGQVGTDGYRAVCTATRRGVSTPFVSRFAIADAKKANLWGKAGPWQQYQDRMLQMRARSFCLRNGFADVIKGLIAREEAEDIPPRDVECTVVVEQPRRKSEAQAQPEPAPAAEVKAAQPAPAPMQPVATPTANGKTYPEPAGDTRPISEPQRKRLYDLCDKCGISNEIAKGYIAKCGFTSSKEITREAYPGICAWIERGGVDEPPADVATSGDRATEEQGMFEREPGAEG